MTHGNDEHNRASAHLDRREIAATDFVATVIDVDAPKPGDPLDPQWWSESVDGRCSESAAVFAASQPAPLSVV